MGPVNSVLQYLGLATDPAEIKVAPVSESTAASQPEPADPGPPAQNWCMNTYYHSKREKGRIWTSAICEKEMQVDVSHILQNIDNYLFDYGPEDLADLSNKDDLNTCAYNSASVSEFTECHDDDPLWRIEMEKRVNAQLASRDVSADEKVLISNDIQRTSRLSRRAHHSVFKAQETPEHGDVKSVFGFSGRA